ncbi:hypothetical protein AAMO2058_001481100 [Amorphochlora amoebiformis]|mmetsp:Transcript_11381/g.17976  ORF Transcript_11381/g.17976 Transcript_11381/m.17976 type:complete len:399 (-) Transcript_11381:338-1534(-)
MGSGASMTPMMGLKEPNAEAKSFSSKQGLKSPKAVERVAVKEKPETKCESKQPDYKSDTEKKSKGDRNRERRRQSRTTKVQSVVEVCVEGSKNVSSNYSREVKQKEPLRPSKMLDLKGFRINETLCQTVMGCVKRCTRVSDGLECVLKMSRINQGSSDNTIENPINEVRLLRKIGASFDNKSAHPNIIRLVEYVERPTAIWAVMEFATGGELFDLVSEHGALFEDEAKNIMRQAADAVAFMHRNGVAHLDLSLENILIHQGQDGNVVVKIIDFGMAQEIQSSGFNPNGSADQRPGKPAYMAPEIHSGEAFDPERADSFSLGVVYFTMLTGVPPFRLASVHDKRFTYVVGCPNRMLKICERWNRPISEAAALFLSTLICYSSDRITVREMRAEPYLQEL